LAPCLAKFRPCSFPPSPFSALVLTYATKIKSSSCGRTRNFTKDYFESDSTQPSYGMKLAIQGLLYYLENDPTQFKDWESVNQHVQEMLWIYPKKWRNGALMEQVKELEPMIRATENLQSKPTLCQQLYCMFIRYARHQKPFLHQALDEFGILEGWHCAEHNRATTADQNLPKSERRTWCGASWPLCLLGNNTLHTRGVLDADWKLQYPGEGSRRALTPQARPIWAITTVISVYKTVSFSISSITDRRNVIRAQSVRELSYYAGNKNKIVFDTRSGTLARYFTRSSMRWILFMLNDSDG